MGCVSFLASSVEEFRQVIADAIAIEGPTVVEVDMTAIGPLNFAGPPQKKLY